MCARIAALQCGPCSKKGGAKQGRWPRAGSIFFRVGIPADLPLTNAYSGIITQVRLHTVSLINFGLAVALSSTLSLSEIATEARVAIGPREGLAIAFLIWANEM